MFLVEVKTLFVEAMKGVFTDSFSIEKFRNLYVSMEFPEDKVNYPGIWVDFAPTAALQVAGIGHVEYISVDDHGGVRRGTVWRFGGQVSFTVSAMTSLERDTLVDEVVKVMAFGSENPELSVFRSTLEVNDLIKISMQWDTFELTGKGETSGTPWNTDEIIYEMTVQVDLQGQFVSDDVAGETMIPLSAVQTTPIGPDDPPHTFVPDTTDPIEGVDRRNTVWQ